MICFHASSRQRSLIFKGNKDANAIFTKVGYCEEVLE